MEYVLPILISKNQSGLAKERNIMKKLLLAREIIFYTKMRETPVGHGDQIEYSKGF